MLRRGFLGALLGLAASPVLARLDWVTETPLIKVIESPIILPGLLFAGDIEQIHITGQLEYQRVLRTRMMRQGGGTLMEFAISSLGGSLFYVATPWERVRSTREHPVVLDVPDGAEMRLYYRPLNGSRPRCIVVKDGTSKELPT